MQSAQSRSLPDLRDDDNEFKKSGFFALKRSSKVRDINLEEIRQRRASIHHGNKKKQQMVQQEEQERWERRRRGLYGLSNSEKACFARPVPAAPEALARMKDEKRSLSKGEGSVKALRSDGEEGSQSPKMRRRYAALVTEKAALSSVEMTEEAVECILRVLFPTNPVSMARVGSSYRRQRGVKALAFQANNPSLSVPVLPSINALSDDGAVKRSLTSMLKPSKDRQSHEARDFKAQPLSPRSALEQSLKKAVSGIDVAQLKKMSDLLKRELNIKFDAQDSSAPRRQPLYVTPENAGTKRNKDVLGRSKYEASSVAEVWESAEQPDFTKKPVFHRLKNAALLVRKIGDMSDELNKESGEPLAFAKRLQPAPLADDCNFSLRKFRKRLLGKHVCLADAFRCLDLNVNQKLGPEEWGAMFRGSGLATFREARISFELLDLNRDGSVTLAEFQAALEGVAEITGIDGLRKRLVSFGYTKTMQALEAMEGNGFINPAKPLILEEFGAALCRIHVVELDEHRAIFDNVRDSGDPVSKASLFDLVAALGAVGPSLLMEDIAERARQKFGNTDAIWEGLGPGSSSKENIELKVFERKLIDRLGLAKAAAQKACRILDVDDGGDLSRSELISALALSRPTLHMEDFRRKVQQRYRSIEAIFRESFEHLENEELNNDDDMRLTCPEFAEILEELDFSRRETSYLFWLADASGTAKLTLYEFFRGVKLFVPSCVVEGIRLQALVHHRRIADLFRNSGVAWDRRLNCQAFAQLLCKLDVKCEEPQLIFDFLDVRSCGSVCISEVVSCLQNLTPGVKERSTSQESDKRVEKDVRAALAPMHKTVTELKSTMKRDLSEDVGRRVSMSVSPRSLHPPEKKGEKAEKPELQGSAAVAIPAVGPKASDIPAAVLNETFHRINGAPEGRKNNPSVTDYCGKKTVDGLCGYLKSTSDILEAHRPLLSHHYSRTDWHKKQESIKAVLNRRI
ncbi:unnamed protein product [Symbiodinium natans]|uniref:EF-hand domain-containing protein n=1 Tax=Symbiodinium natans TaxID=878477 RepID=A0A812QGR9_9DINO|nr:unnamed protein product [Symbiodinium natans]